MSNSYFNRAFDVLPGTLGRSQAIEDEFTRLEQGFDKLPGPRAAADGFDVLRVTGDPSEPRDVVPLSWLQSTFLSISTAASTYLTQANAASTYLTQANAAATYLTQSGAAATYTTPAAVQAALTAYAGTNLGLPTFTGADALKTLRINSGGSGYEWAQVVESLNGLQGAIALKTLAGQALTGSGDINTLSGPLNWAATATLASAATVDIGAAASNVISVTGTTTITSLGTIAAGAERVLTFAGALTLTHNATSLILPGGASITTAAGDVAYFVSLGSGNWRCTGYQKADGTPIVSPSGVPSLPRSTRTSNTILAAGDKGTLIDVTSGTFTQTLTAAATLGSGWWCYLANTGTGTVTVDPNASETIGGVTTATLRPGDVWLIVCTGTAFDLKRLAGSTLTVLTSGTSYTVEAGVTRIYVECWGGGGGGARDTGGFSGGGGGGYAAGWLDVTPGQSITYAIGSGGAGRTGSSGAGTAGGNTTFSTLAANGGAGGGQVVSYSSDARAVGGGASGGQVNISGGAGYGIAISGGEKGVGGSSPNGGSGGFSIMNVPNAVFVTQAAQIPGGGGFGSHQSGGWNAGDGARGEIRIRFV